VRRKRRYEDDTKSLTSGVLSKRKTKMTTYRQDSTFQGPQKEIADQSNPLDGNLFGVSIGWFPKGETNTDSSTKRGKCQHGTDTMTIRKGKEAAASITADTVSMFDRLFLVFLVLVGHGEWYFLE
jgi:hypothetical protein